ncbi:unnamed protein product, partial [Effrenium voratum]
FEALSWAPAGRAIRAARAARAMGCGASARAQPVSFDSLRERQHEQLAEGRSARAVACSITGPDATQENSRSRSVSSWDSPAPSEHPGAPDRRLHEWHLARMNKFLHHLQRDPDTLTLSVEMRRGAEELPHVPQC